MNERKSYGRSVNGVDLTEEVVKRLADDAEAGFDVDALKPKMKLGRPPLGEGPAEVVQVRLDPRLRSAVASRAEHDGVNTSEVVREALRRYLSVA